MVKTFEARRIVERLNKDKELIADFLVKRLEYYESIERGDNLDAVRADLRGAREIVKYWESRNVVNRNLVKADMQAAELEEMLVAAGLDGAECKKNTINPVYIRHIEIAIEQKDDQILREAYKILAETQNPDDIIVSTKDLINAYFRAKENKTAAKTEKKQRKTADESEDTSKSYLKNREAGAAEPADIAVEPEEDSADCNLEDKLKSIKPAPEADAVEAEPAEPSNGKGIAPPIRSQGFDPKKSKFQPEEKPDYSFDDVVGLEDVKEQVKVKMVYPYTMPERAKELGLRGGGGILLYGPPGTGKTSMARAVAGEIGIPFFNINPDEIDGRTAEKTVANIRELFRVIRSYDKSVVFFDEVNVFFPTNPSTKSAIIANREFQTQLSGYDSLTNSSDSRILLIGATNKPWALNRAMLRFERFGEKIYVGFPDAEAREGLFRMKLGGRDLAEDIDYKTLAEWTVDATSGDVYSGADIAQVCQRAAEYSLGHTAKTGEAIKIDMVILRNIIDQITPTGLTPNAYDSREMDRFRQEI